MQIDEYFRDTTHVLLLHGLGGKAKLSFLGISGYLRYAMGYKNIHIPTYPADQHDDLDSCLNFIDDYLLDIGLNKEDRLIIIGQSMGGVYAHNLHKKGWENIFLSISIGSPLKGASILHSAEKYLPAFIKDPLNKPPYDYLKKNIEQSEPPHPYHCVTMGWFYGTNFDGCVFRDEAYLDEKNSTHYEFSDHRFFNFSPRLFFKLHELIQKEYNTYLLLNNVEAKSAL